MRSACWWLIALGIATRVAVVLALQSYTLPRSTYEHGEIAANLLAGQGFSTRFLGAEGPTSQQAPVYPVVVAAAFAAGGGETPQALLILELGQAVLGGLLVALVWALARELAPRSRRFPVIAALVAALHPTLVYAATHVQVAQLAAVLLTFSLICAYRARRTGQRRDVLATGVAIGVLVLTDPILGLVAPGASWLVSRGARNARAGLVNLACLGIAVAIVVAPWIIRNARVHGEFVPVKSTFGYAFWQGNCQQSQGTDKVLRASVERVLSNRAPGLSNWNRALWEARHEAGYIDDIALRPADYHALSALSEPERSRMLYRRARAELAESPGRYVELCLKRLRMFLLFDETNPKASHPIYRVAHVGLTVFALVGLLTMGPELLRRMAPTILTVLFVTCFHAATIVSARFHVPLEPLMGLWGAAALGRLAGTRNVADGAIRPRPHEPFASRSRHWHSGIDVARDSE